MIEATSSPGILSLPVLLLVVVHASVNSQNDLEVIMIVSYQRSWVIGPTDGCIVFPYSLVCDSDYTFIMEGSFLIC